MNYATRLVHLLQREVAAKEGQEPPNMELYSAQLGIRLISLRGMHALEVGCGSGVPVLEILLAKEMDVIGVDLSPEQLALAAGHFPLQTAGLQAVWAEKDMMDLRYPPNEFDVIVGLYSLIHLPREEQTVFLHRVVRWLKPGGMILMNFAQEELEGDVNEKWLGHEKGWMYWSSWGEEKTIQLIEDLGFEILVREVGHDDPADANFVWVIAKKLAPVEQDPVEQLTGSYT